MIKKKLLNTGIYAGENKVVHFTAQDNTGSGSRSSSGFGRNFFSSFPSSHSSNSATCSSILGCGYHQPGSGVILSCLNCFIGNGSLYLFQYEVSKFAYITEVRGGTCTTAKSDPPEEVIYRAMYLLQNGFGSYDVIRNNCEDFALYCKTGLLIRGKPITGTSGQVNFLLNEPWKVIVSSIIQKIVGGPMGAFAAVASAQAHGLNRYETDIGVRDDVEKVNVEDLALFREN